MLQESVKLIQVEQKGNKREVTDMAGQPQGIIGTDNTGISVNRIAKEQLGHRPGITRAPGLSPQGPQSVGSPVQALGGGRDSAGISPLASRLL